MDDYKSLVEKTIKPRIGSLPLQAVTGGRLNAFYADLLKSGRRDGRGGLSPATVRYVHAVLRKAFSDAVRWNQLTRNVADAADPPRPSKPQIRTWTLAKCERSCVTSSRIASTRRTSSRPQRG